MEGLLVSLLLMTVNWKGPKLSPSGVETSQSSAVSVSALESQGHPKSLTNQKLYKNIFFAIANAVDSILHD